MTQIMDFSELAAYDRHARRLDVGLQAYSRRTLANPECDHTNPANNWIACRLGLPWPENSVNTWPPAMQQQWRGWQTFYQGQYAKSAQHFNQAAQHNPPHDPLGLQGNIALGLGKVYTRTGHWQAARTWILQGLSHARSPHDMFGVVQGYGALGELFVRSGHCREALACMSITFHLMPPGAGQQSKQLNFMASALIRNREYLRAESLLQTALHTANDLSVRHHNQSLQREARDSILHAKARLQFLELDKNQMEATDLFPQTDTDNHSPAGLHIAEGFLCMGRAFVACQQDNHPLAITCVHRAGSAFGDTYPMERHWAALLEAKVKGLPLPDRQDIAALISMTPELPTQTGANILDQTWEQTPLPEDNGFSPLLSEQLDLQALLDMRQMFFL